MSKLNIKLEEKEEIILYGIWTKSNDKTVSKDINKLSKQYKNISGSKEKITIPYFVVYKNYNKQTKNFDLFIGSVKNNNNLEKFILKKGKYAMTEVKPKLGFLWGLAIGEVKRYFYTDWILKNDHKSLNLEYEYHTEKSIGKSPKIDIIFAIE